MPSGFIYYTEAKNGAQFLRVAVTPPHIKEQERVLATVTGALEAVEGLSTTPWTRFMEFLKASM
jgi:hypothetical protein